jgi:hypothetical protein
MAPAAWLVTWDDEGAVSRAFVDEREAREWAARIADTEGCSGVAVLPLAVVKDSLTGEPSGNSGQLEAPRQYHTRFVRVADERGYVLLFEEGGELVEVPEASFVLFDTEADALAFAEGLETPPDVHPIGLPT